MKRRANGRSLSVAATACSVLLAVSRAAIAQDTPAATASGDQAVVERVTTQLVDLMPDDSKVASLKIKRLLDLLPDNFDYTSSKVMRQAKCRVCAYELDRLIEGLPPRPRKPIKWGCFMVIDTDVHPTRGPEIPSVICCNINDDGSHADKHGGENHKCAACAMTENTGRQVAHDCWFCTDESYIQFDDGSRENFHLSVNQWHDPFQRDPKQRGGWVWRRQQVIAANDRLLQQRQQQAEQQLIAFKDASGKVLPLIRTNLNTLRAIDKDGLYEQVCTRAEQCLTSLVEKAR